MLPNFPPSQSFGGIFFFAYVSGGSNVPDFFFFWLPIFTNYGIGRIRFFFTFGFAPYLSAFLGVHGVFYASFLGEVGMRHFFLTPVPVQDLRCAAMCCSCGGFVPCMRYVNLGSVNFHLHVIFTAIFWRRRYETNTTRGSHFRFFVVCHSQYIVQGSCGSFVQRTRYVSLSPANFHYPYFTTQTRSAGPTSDFSLYPVSRSTTTLYASLYDVQ